jgi:hypothetical protein
MSRGRAGWLAHSISNFGFQSDFMIWVPLDKNEGVVKAHVFGRVPEAR